MTGFKLIGSLTTLMVLGLGVAGCDSDADDVGEPGACDVGAAPLEITGHSFVGQYLLLDVTYAGGCADHSFAVWWSGAVAASAPPQTELVLHHYDGGDTCEALVTDQIVIDCSALDSSASPRIGTNNVGDEEQQGPPAMQITVAQQGAPRPPAYPSFFYEVPDAPVAAPSGTTPLEIDRDCLAGSL